MYVRVYREIFKVVSSLSQALKMTESKTMNEKILERKLVSAVRKMGGLCIKFVSPGLDGVPDRIILLPGGHIGFAEIKTTGLQPRPLQMRRKRQFKKLGFSVFILDRPEQIGGIIDEIQSS